MTVANIVWSRKHGALAGDDPWQADTLEWSTTSPPPDQNFTAVPVVESLHPLWFPGPVRLAIPADVDTAARTQGEVGALERTTPITSGLDSLPEFEVLVPTPSPLPVLAALGVTIFFIGMLISAAFVLAVGGLVVLGGITTWAWRTEMDHP